MVWLGIKIGYTQSTVVQTVKKHYHKQNTNHYFVIYRTVIMVCGKVAIFTVSLVSPPNGKVDGCCCGQFFMGAILNEF